LLNLLGTLEKKRANSGDATLLHQLISQNVNPGKRLDEKDVPFEMFDGWVRASQKLVIHPAATAPTLVSGS